MAIRTNVQTNIKARVDKFKSEDKFIQINYMNPFYYPMVNPYFVSTFEPFFNHYNPYFAQYQIPRQVKIQNQQSIANIYKVFNQPSTILKNQYQKTNELIQQTLIVKVPKKKTDVSNCKKKEKKIYKRKCKEPKEQKIVDEMTQIKFRYTYKNFESNILNKIFSFIWSPDKSKSFADKILKDKTKLTLYYDYIKIIRKFCRRYINKEYLKNLCNYKIQHIAYKIVLKQGEKLKYFSMDQLSKTIRQLIYLYLNNICCSSILTSKKMRPDIWKEHFQKARIIKDYLFNNLSAVQYEEKMSFTYEQIYGQAQQKSQDSVSQISTVKKQ